MSKLFNETFLIYKNELKEIYKAHHKFEDTVYAVKKEYFILKNSEKVHQNEKINQISQLTKISHPNIIRCFILKYLFFF